MINLTPSVKVSGSDESQVFVLIHPFRVFVFDAATSTRARAWRKVIHNTIHMDSRLSSLSDDERKLIVKLVEGAAQPTTSMARSVLKRDRSLTLQTTTCNDLLVQAYNEALVGGKAKPSHLACPVVSLKTLSIIIATLSPQTPVATRSILISNTGRKTLYLQYSSTSSSAFNIALSPPVGVAVKAGRSIQLLATVTFVGKEGSMPSMRAVVPIQVRGGKKLQQRHIATLWVSIATVRN